MVSQAFANPHIITRIGTAPVLGPIESTSALQRAVADNERVFAEAANLVGLSQSEYATVRQRIRTGRLAYGVLPRHLDAMSWGIGGHIGAVRDVIIPANTHGWIINLRETTSNVGVYIPNGCGNISVVRGPSEWHTTPPTTPPKMPPTTPPTSPPTSPPTMTPPTATPTAPTTTEPFHGIVPPPAASSSGHFPWFLLLPIIALIGGGHGGVSIGSPPLGPPNGGPTPPVVCPTPTPHR